jgi:tetratricopeptide (TPR) repeat protein
MSDKLMGFISDHGLKLLTVMRSPLRTSTPTSCSCSESPKVLKPGRRALLTTVAGTAIALFAPTRCQSKTAGSGGDAAVSDKQRLAAIQALRGVTDLQNKAFGLTNRGAFVAADVVWTDIIALNDHNAAAWSNRGNCRTSQGRFTDAVADFDRAIELAPREPDPHLGKGVALEGLRRYEDALHEYDVSNECSLELYGVPDPVVFNNRGNVYGLGMGDWKRAVDSFHQAALLSREYVFARANEALATYQLGMREEGVRMMESLLRKYPDFPDLRAALVAVYWSQSERRGDAETFWLTVMEQDSRYKDIRWVGTIRRWPPVLVQQLNNFLTLKETEA